MRTLILMRHAKAVKGSEAPSDEARGLAPRGRRDAAAASAALAAAGLKPDLALISTAQRTRETADIALSKTSAQARYEDALYLTGPVGIWDAFMASDGDTIVVIGHNPGLGELVSMLIAQAHDKSKAAREFVNNMPTAAFVAFEIRGDVLDAAGPTVRATWRPEKE